MREFFKVLKRFVGPYKWYLGGSIFLNLLSAVFNLFSFAMIIPILDILFKTNEGVTYTFIEWSDSTYEFKDILMNNMSYFVSHLNEQVGGSNTLLIIGCIFGFVTLLKTASYFASAAVLVPMRTGIMRDIRIRIYKKLLSLPIGFFSHQKKGDIIARMSGDVNEVENSITSSLEMLIKNPILIAIYFVTLFYISWELTLFTLAVVPVISLTMGAIGKKLRRQSHDLQSKWSDTLSQIEETVGGVRVIKAFNAEEKMNSRFSKIANAVRNAGNKLLIRQASAHPVSEFLGSVMIMTVLWFGGSLIINGKGSFDGSTFIYYMTVLYSVLAPLKELARAGYTIPKGLASMDRIDKILNTENPIKDPVTPKPLTELQKEITIENVHFSYGNEKEVLSDICITIKKGTTVALVGQSGSGKSTLVDLIPRFHDVTQGCIKIDGTDIREFRTHDLRALIGNVNQEAILFNDTIFNNIAFGVENATMEQVVEAAKIANAHDFIMEKEEGYMTNIGDRGSKLSGGQRQRISIARAILKNPQILILDEATSALDTESERLVQEALDRLTGSRTTIAIAHRLSTIKNADEICVMHEGKIVERGKHDELISLNGFYKKLNDMQAL